MSQDSEPIRIGELLCQVGVLTTGDLTEAIQISKRMGVPIGRVLVMSGCVNEVNLQAALEAQSLIKDKLLEVDLAVRALGKVFKDAVALQDALKSLDWQPKPGGSNKLGELLLDSNIVSKEELEKALQASFHSGMPLGGTLVLQGVLSAQLLPTILHAQDEIRAGRMTRQEAVEQLKTAVMYWARAQESKGDDFLQAEKRAPAAAGAQPSYMSTSVFASPSTQVPPSPIPPPQAPSFGTTPQASSPPSFFSAPQQQQGYSVQPAPTPLQANLPLRESPQPLPQPSQRPQPPDSAAPAPPQWSCTKPTGYTNQGAPAPGTTQPAPAQNPAYPLQAATPVQPAGADGDVCLLELLKLSAVCTPSDIQGAIDRALQDSEATARLLLMLGLIDQATLDLFLRCQSLVGRGVLRKEQALFVLNAMRYRSVSFEDALAELGITAPAPGVNR